VLDGYDVVAYFERGAATVGNASLAAVYGGYTFRFASAAARAAFAAAPARYAPSWGGFCAYGVADEAWWTRATLGPQADPQRWALVNGRLFVFRGETPRAEFLAGGNASVAKGDAVWDGWFNATNSSVYNTACFYYIDDDDDAPDGASGGAPPPGSR